MTDGNTMIGSVMTGHGLGKDVDYDEEYLVAEDHALEQQEEKLMNREGGTIEDDETMEREMLTTALVNSVVESSPKKPGEQASDDSSQRYSLRNRRRHTGKGNDKMETAQAPQQQVAQHASVDQTERSNQLTRSAPPTAAPDPVQAGAPPGQGRAQGVPPVTVPTSTPPSSSLPPALQPPQRRGAPPGPSATSTTNAACRPPTSRSKAPAKSKQQRVAPAARIPAPKVPLAPDTAVCGVPNPLSNPFPMSTAATTASNTATNAQTSQRSFKAGTSFTVPCPLPPATFESNARQARPQANGTHTTAAPAPAPEPEKKKTVTISNDLPAQTRGRIFSIDLDPASLDFSVLDPDPESGVPAPASADLPLLSGGPRDRAYSFECFAFGINADEPLSGYGDHSGDGNHHQGHFGARPRGDSIIFDPSSFQEGGIHEEHALTTRETRGMSIDLDSLVSSMPAPSVPAPQTQAPAPSTTNLADSNIMPHTVESSTPKNSRPPHQSHSEVVPPTQHAPVHRPDYAHSNGHMSGAPSHPGNPASRPSNGYQGQQYHAPVPAPTPSNGVVPSSTPSYNPTQVPSTISATPNGTVAVVGSASQTLQMELLNKDGRIGIYLPEARKERIARFHAKRKMRIWRKRIKYDCRKKLADSRPRIKGRFVKRSDMDD